jgi:hypothetical protein
VIDERDALRAREPAPGLPIHFDEEIVIREVASFPETLEACASVVCPRLAIFSRKM